MATKTVSKVSEAELVSELGALQEESARRKFLTGHKSLLRSEVVKRLAPLVVERIRVDTKQALLLSTTNGASRLTTSERSSDLWPVRNLRRAASSCKAPSSETNSASDILLTVLVAISENPIYRAGGAGGLCIFAG